MPAAKIDKARLEELLDLAQCYRGCTRKQLADALGRDPSNLVPDSGVPKLDLVIELAQVLDWPVEDVVNTLWLTNGSTSPRVGESDYGSLESESKRAHREGRYREAIELAQQAYGAARSSAERSVACNREAMGWDGLGRYTSALEAIQRGLREGGSRRMARLWPGAWTAWSVAFGEPCSSHGWLRSTSPEPPRRCGRPPRS